MAVSEFEAILKPEDWYDRYMVDDKGCLIPNGLSDGAARKIRMYNRFKIQADTRLAQYEKYEKQAAAEVVSRKPDLPNISSGESAGFIRRIARNVVQHTPNVFIMNEFDDESIPGVIAQDILKKKIIGDDLYSNNMQQNLNTTFRRGAALGFDCVIPVMTQDNRKRWYIQYDNIHYRDVFPEPGAKDIRRAHDIFIRRYLTRGEVHNLIRTQAHGWDVAALRLLLSTSPMMREWYDHESKKHHVNSEAYEVITWYSDTGEPFLTWSGNMKVLLRVEQNTHPAGEHPVFFFIPEVDDQQPWGKSLLSLTYGRQEFQDLFMNGIMKMLIRNINPPIIAYGTVNGGLNLSPGKFNEIANPNARVEAVEVNTQAMMMFGQVQQQNQANMVQLTGAADQQMAAQNTGGMMSQTPAGVEAQQQMVDITTNNYQKSMEEFFSRYCSYALTIYFAEMKGIKSITPSADLRRALEAEGVDPSAFIHEAHIDDEGNKVPDDGTGLKDGMLKIDFSDMNVEYFVQCVPGSLVELEDDKQLRQLKEVFVPLSQAMPAIAQSGDPQSLRRASQALEYIVKKTIELSGGIHSAEIKKIFAGDVDSVDERDSRIDRVEETIGGLHSENGEFNDAVLEAISRQQEQIATLAEGMRALMNRVQPGIAAQVPGGQTAPPAAEPGAPAPAPELQPA
jgi:hypothetical protein